MKCEYEHLKDHAGPCSGVIEIRHAMTRYVFDGVPNSPEDPNRDFIACEEHANQYNAFWQEQWDEYNSIVRDGLGGAMQVTYRREQCIEYGPSLQDLFDDFAGRVKLK